MMSDPSIVTYKIWMGLDIWDNPAAMAVLSLAEKRKIVMITSIGLLWKLSLSTSNKLE